MSMLVMIAQEYAQERKVNPIGRPPTPTFDTFDTFDIISIVNMFIEM